MIIIIPTIKYGSTYYNTFTMGVCSNYHGHFFQCVGGLEIVFIVSNNIDVYISVDSDFVTFFLFN